MSKVLSDLAKIDSRVRIRYSYLFCEVCETNYRTILATFADGTVFTLCCECATDMRDVVEMFGIDVALSRLQE